MLVVHQAGVPADLDELHALCDPLGLPVVEDAACAARLDLPAAGPSAPAPRSPRGRSTPASSLTTGRGRDAHACEDEAAADRLRRLREHGMDVERRRPRTRTAPPVLESYLETGFNYRLTDMQAAVGLVQLGRLDAIVARRRELAARYQALLARRPRACCWPRDPAYGTTNYQSFWVLLPDDFPVSRNRLLRAHARGRDLAAAAGSWRRTCSRRTRDTRTATCR